MANSATVQSKGVLQVETGYDAYPQNPPGNQQTVDAAFYYTPFSQLRLDFTWSAFAHQQNGNETTNGVSTVTLGGKIVLKPEDYHRWAPGSAPSTRRSCRRLRRSLCRTWASRPSCC